MLLNHAVIAALSLAAAPFMGAAAPSGPVAIQSLATPDIVPEQISEYVRRVFQDGSGDFWFGTNGDGVARFDGETLTYISVEQGLAGRAVRGILQDADGAMWFATDGGVSRYESGRFTSFTEVDGLSDRSVWNIMQDRAGAIWVGTHAGVCRFDGEIFVPFPLPRVEVENPASRFSPEVVFGITQDQAGNLWFGTDGEGVHMYDGESFTSYTQSDGLASNDVRCIVSDRHGRIWIGTNGGGVSRYDGATFQNFTKEDGLNNDRVYEILEDKSGNMWFSTLGAGACRYDGTSFTPFRENYDLMTNGRPAHAHVQDLFEDRDGVLWLGCSGGLFRLDGEVIVNVTRDGPWPETEQGPAAHELDRVSLEGWPSETFALPPAFAPELPTGAESLLFAPGWRDPSTEEFWSYAFVMWIDETTPDATRIDELLETYYTGLMSAFGVGADADVEDDHVRVDVVGAGPDHFEATMRLIDGFATFKPIDLRVLIETVADTEDRSYVRIQVSRQPEEHRIWRSLGAAIERIGFPTEALQVEKGGED